jgi:hypothetical protein
MKNPLVRELGLHLGQGHSASGEEQQARRSVAK